MTTGLHERDMMICRSCGNEERASEGYPCKECGTFICIMCVFKGVVRCGRCVAGGVEVVSGARSDGTSNARASAAGEAARGPGPSSMDWPEH